MRWYPRLAAAFAALLLSCSDGKPVEPPAEEPLAMPTLEQAFPKLPQDSSCACVLLDRCPVYEMGPGIVERRNLNCRVRDAARRTVTCTYETRVWPSGRIGKGRAGEWEPWEDIFHNYAPGAWCAGKAFPVVT